MIHEKLTGQKIKQVCEKKGLSVPDIQKKLGIGAHQSIYNWFNGKSLPTLENYYELCKLLGVTMESLIVECREESSENIINTIWPEAITGTGIFGANIYYGFEQCFRRVIQYKI